MQTWLATIIIIRMMRTSPVVKVNHLRIEDIPAMGKMLLRTGKGELGQILQELRILILMSIMSGLSTVGVFIIAVFLTDRNELSRIVLVGVSFVNLILTALLFREVLRRKRLLDLVRQGKGLVDALTSPSKTIGERIHRKE